MVPEASWLIDVELDDSKVLETERESIESDIVPYRAYIFGNVPCASRMRIGVCGLFFFIVGYALVRNDLQTLIRLTSPQPRSSPALQEEERDALRCWRWGGKGWRRCTNRTAALCSEVWQNRNRTSLRDLVKAYRADIVRVCGRIPAEENMRRYVVVVD